MTILTAERGPAADLERARETLETDREAQAPGAAWGWAAAAAGFAALASILFMTLDGGTSTPAPEGSDIAPAGPVEAALLDPFSDPLPAAEAAAPPVPEAVLIEAPAPEQEPVAAPGPPAPLIAVVIDDVGLDVEAARRVIALPAPVTVSLLPYARAAAALDEEARAAGHETFVHLPMEPVGLADPGPGALATWMDADELAARVGAAFAAVPGATGVNNHMGSHFTACDRCVAPVLAAAADRKLLVLDSLTGADSRFGVDAERAGLRALRRDVFLDHDPAAEKIAARLAEAEEIARTRGWAVVIGHPKEATLAALEAWIPEAREKGFEVGSAGEAYALSVARGEPEG